MFNMMPKPSNVVERVIRETLSLISTDCSHSYSNICMVYSNDYYEWEANIMGQAITIDW